MQIADIPRSTGFRVVVVCMVVLGLAALTSLSLLYVDTVRFLDEHIDNWIRRENASLLALDRGDLASRVQRHTQFDDFTEWPVTLYDSEGHYLAGVDTTLPRHIAADRHPFNFRATLNGESHRYRGVVTHLPDGRTLLVSERLWWASSLDQVVIERSVLGMVIAGVLGLAAAALLGARAQRRIAAFTAVAQRIVSGDLSGRLSIQNQSDDLDRLGAIVNGMLDHIERLVAQIAAFRDAVSHDLASPLTRLQITLEGTRAAATSVADYEHGVEIALIEARRVARMLAAIRRLSDIESGTRRAGFAPVELNEVATEAYDFYQPVAEERGIILRIQFLPHVASMLADHDLLFEALGNLLDNAIKFTPYGGLVTLTVFDGEQPGFEVADSGPGIPDCEHASVLRRSYRLEGTGAVEGSGLGLALVAAIADLHGMHVEIAARSPGCSISLRLRPQDGGTAARIHDALAERLRDALQPSADHDGRARDDRPALRHPRDRLVGAGEDRFSDER